MGIIIIDFSVCCERDKVYVDNSLAIEPFALTIYREVASCSDGDTVIALSNHAETLALLDAEYPQIVTAVSECSRLRTWTEILSEPALKNQEATLLKADGLLLVRPFRGMVSRTRTRLFLTHADPSCVTHSSKIIPVNKNPFWLYMLYPNLVQDDFVRDINITKLPRINENHFDGDQKQFIPPGGTLHGSHNLPDLYERYDAYTHVPASLVPQVVNGGRAPERVVPLNNGHAKPHLLYMLPIQNYHTDARLSL